MILQCIKCKVIPLCHLKLNTNLVKRERFWHPETYKGCGEGFIITRSDRESEIVLIMLLFPISETLGLQEISLIEPPFSSTQETLQPCFCLALCFFKADFKFMVPFSTSVHQKVVRLYSTELID